MSTLAYTRLHPASHLILQLAESYLTRRLFRQILQRIERLAWHGTRSGGLTHDERDENLGHIANPGYYHVTSKEELLFSPSLTTSPE
jgi:hypothetical protein